MRGQVCVADFYCAIDYAQEVFAEGAVDGGGDEFLVVV